MVSLNLFIVFLLILATAFFVAAEFSFIRVRSSKIEQLITEGNKKAINVQKVISNLDGYLSACQLGITITALALGSLGEPTVEKILFPIFESQGLNEALSHSISFILSFSLITFLHVVLGELAPKSLAIQKAERISLLLAVPMIVFYKIMYPFIWVLNGSASKLVGWFGLKPANEHDEVHSEQELKILLSESYESGEINQSEYKYVSKIFDFDELTSREIMVPRTDMGVLDLNNSFEENLSIIKSEHYTRFPVIKGNKDEILGMINTKEVFLSIIDGKQETNLEELLRPVLTVIESTPIKSLMHKMQKEGSPFAILVDEYGGTSGLVTLENILEEIVGDIRDEFDHDERPEIEVISSEELVVDGKVLISEVDSLLGLELVSETVDSIGGWLATKNPELKKNETFSFENVEFTILDTSKNRYVKIRIKINQIYDEITPMKWNRRVEDSIED